MPRNCFSCSKSLASSHYYSKNDQSFCSECYEVQFSKTCHKCNQKIQARDKGLIWRNTEWHDHCFNCTQCNTSLLQWAQSFAKSNLPYCSHCYNSLFSPKCEECGEVIQSGTSYVIVQNKRLHPHCFTCAQCKITLGRQRYHGHDGRPYCSDCDRQLFCPKCASCGLVIERDTRYSIIDGQNIHPKCFTCFDCGNAIVGSLYNKRNGHNYHTQCVRNSSYSDEYVRRPARNAQRSDNERSTTVTSLDLRSSRIQSSVTYRSTRVKRTCNNVLLELVNKLIPVQTNENFATKVVCDSTSQTEEQRSLTAGPRRPLDPIYQKENKSKDTIQADQTGEDFPPRTSPQCLLRIHPTLPAIVYGKVQEEKDNSNQVPPDPVPRKTRTCQVCYEDKTAALYEESISHQCQHPERTICRECIYRHVANAFAEMCRDDVRCPETDCPIILDYDAIKKILCDANDQALFNRFDQFNFKTQLEKTPEFLWCAHGCGSGQLVENGFENNIVTCANCRKKSCFIHRTIWHRGLTCAQYDEQTDPGRRATKQWLARQTKKCPGCQSPIEKRAGCDHMTCSRCHFEFCWACLADHMLILQNGNHYHQEHCKHFRRNNR